jgi:tryptophan 2,3-dioxygenase
MTRCVKRMQKSLASDSKGMSACEERLTRWFNSKLSSLVNDYSESAKEFSTCSAFALGTSDRYRKIKFLLANQDDYLQETPATQAAIDQLRESIQKFDMSMKHGLYYHAYQHEMEDTYTPPAVRLGG